MWWLGALGLGLVFFLRDRAAKPENSPAPAQSGPVIIVSTFHTTDEATAAGWSPVTVNQEGTPVLDPNGSWWWQNADGSQATDLSDLL